MSVSNSVMTTKGTWLVRSSVYQVASKQKRMSWSSAGEVCVRGDSFGCIGSARCCGDFDRGSNSGGGNGGCGASEGHAADGGGGVGASGARSNVFNMDATVKFFAVFPQAQVQAGDAAYLDRYGELCTRAEMVKATAAMNNLSDLNSLGSAIMAVVYGNDSVKWSCAAESIIGRCIRVNETHQCWKTSAPVLYQCEADRAKSAALRARMKARGF